MGKYIWMVRSPEGMEREAFASAVLRELAPRLLELGPDRLKISLTETKPPGFSLLPLRKTDLALVSVWGNVEGATDSWLAAMFGLGHVSGYRVTESVPRAYDRNWPDGTASPGAVLLTLMKKNPALSRDEFMEEWFARHTPMALKIHPLWNYIRNVVDSAIVEDSPPYDGIVEESFRSLRDITNPVRMFGGPLRMLPNMLKTVRHTSMFLNLREIENYILTEHHIRS